MFGYHVASHSFEDYRVQCEPQLRQRWTACEVAWMSEQSADAVTRMEERTMCDRQCSVGRPRAGAKLQAESGQESGSSCLVPA
jgi:hypothetical protein